MSKKSLLIELVGLRLDNHLLPATILLACRKHGVSVSWAYYQWLSNNDERENTPILRRVNKLLELIREHDENL